MIDDVQAACTAQSPEKIEVIAKENDMAITAEQATEIYARLHGPSPSPSDSPVDVLADEELADVAGGRCRGLQRPYCNECDAYRTGYAGAVRHYCPNRETFYNLVDSAYMCG